MCRNVNLYFLETIIYGCNLDAYILNREPRLSFFIIINNIYLELFREFEFLRILIDGALVQGQKRLKRPWRTSWVKISLQNQNKVVRFSCKPKSELICNIEMMSG